MKQLLVITSARKSFLEWRAKSDRGQCRHISSPPQLKYAPEDSIVMILGRVEDLAKTYDLWDLQEFWAWTEVMKWRDPNQKAAFQQLIETVSEERKEHIERINRNLGFDIRNPEN